MSVTTEPSAFVLGNPHAHAHVHQHHQHQQHQHQHQHQHRYAQQQRSRQELVCLWQQCLRTFDDAEVLYAHLTNDHIGRKSTGNLCLSCHWDKCNVTTTKRDHITSHLRVHVPLKPHACETCNKAFKRPQDLKKHEKIHTEEHQHQISMNKHERLRRNLQPPTPPYYPDRSAGISPSGSPPVHARLPPSGAGSMDRTVGSLNTPPHEAYEDPTSIGRSYGAPAGCCSLAGDALPSGITSHKRPGDTIGELYNEVKRKCIEPVYNQGT